MVKKSNVVKYRYRLKTHNGRYGIDNFKCVQRKVLGIFWVTIAVEEYDGPVTISAAKRVEKS